MDNSKLDFLFPMLEYASWVIIKQKGVSRGRKWTGSFLFSSISQLSLLGAHFVCHMRDLSLPFIENRKKKNKQTNNYDRAPSIFILLHCHILSAIFLNLLGSDRRPDNNKQCKDRFVIACFFLPLFRLFMTTRNPHPELPPDGFAIISEVNFTTTRAGLTGQVRQV